MCVLDGEDRFFNFEINNKKNSLKMRKFKSFD